MKKNMKVDWYENNEWNKYLVKDIADLFSPQPNWDLVEDIMNIGINKVSVNLKNGYNYIYHDIHGTYGNPTRIRN